MDRRSTDALIMTIAAANGMVVTTGQLVAAGLSHHVIRGRAGGLLTPMARGVFAVGPVTPAIRLRAALAMVPTGAASHRTAASIRHLPVGEVAEHQVLVLLGRRSSRTIDGVRFRGTRWLPEADVDLVDGMRVTTVARTLCDLAVALPPGRLRHLTEEAISAGLVTTLAFQACASAWCRKGRAGSGRVRALDLELFDADPLAASELERRAARLFRKAGSAPCAQYRPPWYDGVRGIVDLAWPEFRLVVELDGRRWHTTSQAMFEDRRRDRLAAGHGWATLRFGWQEIVHRPQTVVDEWRAVASVRSASPGLPSW